MTTAKLQTLSDKGKNPHLLCGARLLGLVAQRLALALQLLLLLLRLPYLALSLARLRCTQMVVVRIQMGDEVLHTAVCSRMETIQSCRQRLAPALQLLPLLLRLTFLAPLLQAMHDPGR